MVVGGVLPSAPKKTLARFGERREPMPPPVAPKAVQAESTTVFPTYEKDGIAYYDLAAIYKDKGLLPVFIEQYPQSKEYFAALDKPPVAAETPQVIEQPPIQLVAPEPSDAVRLETGEFVTKASWAALSPADQSLLRLVGITQYGAIKQGQAVDAVNADYVQLQTGEYISRPEFEAMSLYDQSLLKASGVAGFNKIKEDEFLQANLEVRPGEYINRVFYGSLPASEQGYIRAQGVESYNAAKQAEYQQSQDIFNRAIQWMSVDGMGNRSIDVVNAISKGGFTTAELNKLGITDEQIQQAYMAEPGFNTIVIPPTQQAVETISRPQARLGGYPITPEMEELEPYVVDRSAGGQAQYNVQAYIQDKGVNSETIGVLQNVGYSAPVINAMVALAPYGGDAVQFVRDNPQAVTILTSAGFAPEAVQQAQEKARLAPYYGDYESGYLQRQGITQSEIELANKQEQLQLGGIAAAASFGYRKPEEAEAQREVFLKVEQAKSAAYQEYIKEYGGEAFAQSVGAMYVSPVFAAGRALRPDVEIKDISGAEWVQTAGMALALAAIPLGVTSLGVLANAGAVSAFAAHTAMEWNTMTPPQRAASVAADIAFGVAVFGAPFVSWLKTANLGTNGITAANKIKAFLKELAVSERGSIGYTTQKAVDASGRIIEVKVAARGFQPGLSGSKVMTVERTALEAATWKPISQAQVNDAMRSITESLAKNLKPTAKDIEIVVKRVSETAADVAKARAIESARSAAIGKYNTLLREYDAAYATAREKGISGAELYKLGMTKNAAGAVIPGAPLPLAESIANIRAAIAKLSPKVDIAALARELKATGQVTLQTPLPSTLGVNPGLVTTIWGMARYIPDMDAGLTSAVASQYGITPANVIGSQPLSQTQLTNIARAVGMAQSAIDSAIATNTLAQAITQTMVVTTAEITPVTSTVLAAVAKEAQAELQAIGIVSPEVLAQTAVMPSTATMPATQTAISVATQPITTTTATTQPRYVPPPTIKPPSIKSPALPPARTKARLPSISLAFETEKEKRKRFKGASTWKQGFGWWAIKEPYASKDDAAFFYKKPPPGARIVKGGAKSAYRSIQTITGKAPAQLIVDMGIMDVIIRQPDKSPGGKGDITFTPDNKQQTRGDIELKDEGLSMMRQPVVRPVPFTPAPPPVLKKAKKKKAKKKSSTQSLISQIIMGK